MEHLVPVQVTTNLGTIEDNLNAVEASIREKTKEYKAIVVTEGSIADGKKFLADIRREKAALDQQRKDIKKAWMKPYDDFEKRAKEIIQLYDEPIGAINAQLSEYEERRKEEKREEIRSIYDFVKGDLEGWLPLEAIYDPRWENKSYKSRDIREDMERCFDQMKLSISTVEQMHSPYEEQGLLVLKNTRSLQEAIAAMQAQEEKQRELEAYHQRQKELEEQRKREEEERQQKLAAEEEAKRAAEVQEIMDGQTAEDRSAAVPQEFAESADMTPDFPFSPARSYTLTATVDENQLEDVRTFFDSLGIEYEVN